MYIKYQYFKKVSEAIIESSVSIFNVLLEEETDTVGSFFCKYIQ